jgi:hypothetical protein
VSEITDLVGLNHKQIKINYDTYSILFKDVAAMKLLNLLFKENKDHALYPIYLQWTGKPDGEPKEKLKEESKEDELNGIIYRDVFAEK